MPLKAAESGSDTPSLKDCSEQEIPLSHRQARCRLTGEQLAIGADLVGLCVDLHFGCVVVVDHVVLAHGADVFGDGDLLL